MENTGPSADGGRQGEDEQQQEMTSRECLAAFEEEQRRGSEEASEDEREDDAGPAQERGSGDGRDTVAIATVAGKETVPESASPEDANSGAQADDSRNVAGEREDDNDGREEAAPTDTFLDGVERQIAAEKEVERKLLMEVDNSSNMMRDAILVRSAPPDHAIHHETHTSTYASSHLHTAQFSLYHRPCPILSSANRKASIRCASASLA